MKKKIILFLMLFPFSVLAHPHTWIDAEIIVNFKAEKITSITQSWTFDDIFSTGIIADYDKNKNKKLEKSEISNIEKNAFSNLKNYGFYTHLFVDGKKKEIKTFKDFSAKIEGDKVIYTFTLPLKNQIDPFTQKVDIGIYDSEYYIELMYTKSPFKSIGNKKKCPYTIFEDSKHPTYMGMVNPKTIKVCR